MVVLEEGTGTYMCERCMLHYRSKGLAEHCEAWDAVHNSCNLAIAQQSEEVRAKKAAMR